MDRPKAKGKKTRSAKKRKPNWDQLYAETDAPTCDLFAGVDVADHCALETALDDLLHNLEGDYFLAWEAVVLDEEDLPLSEAHEDALDSLLSMGDSGRILYVNEIERPSQPWYQWARKVAAALLKQPFHTAEYHAQVTTEGWRRLAEAIEGHSTQLGLPEGVSRPLDVIPVDLQHGLWLQVCFGELEGLGQNGVSLSDEDESWRVSSFVEALQEHRESVEHLGLTLQELFTRVILPPTEEALLVEQLQERLGVGPTDPLAPALA